MATHHREGVYAILGGTAGIGRALAQLLVERGDHVLIGGRSPERLAAATEALGESAVGQIVDMTDDRSVQAFFEGHRNLAGLFTLGSARPTPGFRDGDATAARTMFDAKFWSQYDAVRYALGHLADDAGIVLMAGVASVIPLGSAGYTACNAAVEGLARGLAIDLAPRRVNCLSPGIIDSDLWRARPSEQRDAAYLAWRERAATGRVGSVEDAAAAALFLLDNANISGTTLYIDGGVALR